MQSPDDDKSRVVDNSVILMSLMLARFHLLRTVKAFPKPIHDALVKRITILIKRYKNPTA